MRKTVFKVLLLLLIIFGFYSSSMAEQPGELDRPYKKEQIEKVRKRIETLRMWKLTEALNLDEKSSARLFPILSKYDKKRAEIEDALRDGMRNLRASLREDSKEQLKNLLDTLELNHKSLQKLKEAEWEELKGVLTIQQQARFIVFLQDFRLELRKIIHEARDRRPKRFEKTEPDDSLLPEKY